jgi:hypothetical protein
MDRLRKFGWKLREKLKPIVESPSPTSGRGGDHHVVKLDAFLLVDRHGQNLGVAAALISDLENAAHESRPRHAAADQPLINGGDATTSTSSGSPF